MIVRKIVVRTRRDVSEDMFAAKIRGAATSGREILDESDSRAI